MRKEQLSQGLLDAIIGRSDLAVKALLERGADPNYCEDSAKITPLHFVALHDLPDSVSVLVLAGAKIKVRNADGETPMDIARRCGHRRVLAELKKYSYMIPVESSS